MKHARSILPLALATFVVTLTARPCSPDFSEAVFVLQTGPGGNYASYAAGRIGVPQNAYRTRHLVLAYDYLSGHPLPPEVQQQAIRVNTYLLDPWQADNSDQPRSGVSAWIAARATFGPVDGYTPSAPLATERHVPGEDYTSFSNCLDDAFAAAGRTLAARVTAHPANDPAVADWVRAQDAVFTNCSDGRVLNFYGPSGQAPKPPPVPRAPAAAPANAPLWLKQDRAYQLGAASFYHLDFDDALRRFRALAADHDSPWSVLARYLMARTYARKASLENADRTSSGDPHDAKRKAAAAEHKATLRLAQHELLAMQTEPRMAPMRGAIHGLLDYVNIRLQPDAQAAVLAARLQAPDAATFRQAVLDLTWLHSSHNSDPPVPPLNSAAHASDMLAWIDAVNGKDEVSALKHWHDTHATVWLVAVLANASPGGSDTPALLKAAQSVSPTDPGWLALTYNRLRLSPQDSATRGEVLALLPKLERTGDLSTINLFLALSTATAPNLKDWLAAVSRTPAGESFGETGEEAFSNATFASTDDAVRGTTSVFVEDDCGKRFPAKTVLPLFDTDAAAIFNRDMPLRLLAQAAESSMLPENLRFQVAQATWARAVLLEKPEIGRRMTPILTACRAAWTPILKAYDSATTADTRHVTGLLALMRFASTVPSVWEGEERRQGFATYDETRENWWCTPVPRPGETIDADPDSSIGADGKTPASSPEIKAFAMPPFLTQADLAEAHTEVAALERIPRASTYFAQSALAWQKLHPADPQTPDLLGEADRVVRNSCRKDPPFDVHGKTQLDPVDMSLTPKPGQGALRGRCNAAMRRVCGRNATHPGSSQQIVWSLRTSAATGRRVPRTSSSGERCRLPCRR